MTTSKEIQNYFEEVIITLFEKQQEYAKFIIPRLVAIYLKNYFGFEYIYKNMFPEIEGYSIVEPDEKIKDQVTEDTTIDDLEKKYEKQLMDENKSETLQKFYKQHNDLVIQNKVIMAFMEYTLGPNPYTVPLRLRTVLRTFRKNLHKKEVHKLLIHLLKLKYNFFVVDTAKPNNRHETKYYILENGIYKEINRGWLMTKLNELAALEGTEIFLTLEDCTNILSYIGEVREFNNNYVELDNVYIKKSNMEIIEKSGGKFILTDDRLGIQDGDTIKLFKYDSNIRLDTINDENITDTFKILKEILIPKQSPSNKKYLLFYLQLIGLMAHGKNDIKILPLFYKEGNNGKSILKDIAEILFKDGSISIAGNEFKDKFINESINKATHCILNDELDIDDIKKYQSYYKNISGGSSIGGRGMYSTEQTKVEEIAPAMLCSNYIPNVPISKENEAIIKRLIIIPMPNKFVESYEYNPNKNHYKLISNVKQKIKNDYDGLNQVLNVAINEFKELNYDRNVKEQLAVHPTIQDTLFLLTKENPLLSYLMLYFEEIPDNTTYSQRITITDIKNEFISWYKPQNNGLMPPETMLNPLNIGKYIKTVFPEINIKSDGNKKYYNLKIKNSKTLEKEQYELIKAHPKNSENMTHNIGGLSEKIHDFIMSNPDANCEHDIIEEFEPAGYTVDDIMDSLKHLDEIGLIEYQTQQTL